MMANLTLKVPGERIAHEIMRQTLQEIAEAYKADPYGYTAAEAAEEATEALVAVVALEGE